MNTFLTFCKFEAKRFCCKRNAIIVSLLFVFALGILQVSAWNYGNTLKLKDEFQRIEKDKVSKIINYRIYGIYGYRTIFLGAPIGIFFSESAVVRDVNSFVDSGERLNIYLPMKGKYIFDLKKSGFMDLSGVILFFGTLLALLYGIDAGRSREYLKFLSSIAGKRQVFFSISISRIIILLTLFTMLIAGAMALTAINGFYIPIDKYLAVFIAMVWMLLIFFFMLGAAFGFRKNRVIAFTLSLVTWFFLVFIIPDAVNTVVARIGDHITPVYQLEREKMNILAKFERRSIEIAGIFDTKRVSSKDKELAISYLNNEFKRIEALEQDMRGQMKQCISLFQRLSGFFPTTLYRSANNEISSRGFENLVDFYQRAQEQKGGFVRYCIDKIYFSNFSRVIPYIKGDENVYRAKSRLPGDFLQGMLLTVLYILGLTQISYRGFRKVIFHLPENNREKPDLDKLGIQREQLNVFSVEGKLFNNQLYCLLSGETGGRSRGSRFAYLCHPGHIPGDIKLKHLIGLAAGLMSINREDIERAFKGTGEKSIMKKTFRQLKRIEKGEFFLALLKNKPMDIYLVNDISAGIHPVFDVRMKQVLDDLKNKGCLVILLTHDDILRMKSLDTGKYFFKSDSWCGIVDRYAGMDEIKKALEVYDH
jgi:hypothetical protein